MNSAAETLAHFLWLQSWQLLLFFPVVWVVCRALRGASAHWRYGLWLVLLVKCCVPSFLLVPAPVVSEAVPWIVAAVQAPFGSREAAVMAESSPAASGATTRVESAAPFWRRWAWPQRGLAVWALGAAGFLAVALVKAGRIQRELRGARTLPVLELELEFLALVRAFGLRSRPKLCLIRGLSQPFVWGVWRGCIYLPAGFGQQGTEPQRKLVMAHELAHVARWDALVNFLQVFAQALFVFHPLVWWLNRIIRHEREKCCDEMAVAGLNVSSREYGSAIVDRLVDYFEPACPSSSLAISGQARDLEDRIASLLRPGRVFHRRPSRALWATLAVVAALGLPTGLSVASSSATGAGRSRIGAPAVLDLAPYFNASLKAGWLTTNADNGLAELKAGPQWLGGASFDVQGVVQLAGRLEDQRFPKAINRLPVGVAFQRLHLLHAANGRETEGATVATVVLRYADGQTARLPMLYGERVRDWRFTEYEPVRNPNTVTAWTGNNAEARARNEALRLYRTTWDNPRPGHAVASLDVVSARSRSAPFVLAMTIE